MADWKQDYTIIKELGFGRTSTVYLAEHARHGRVALKVLHPGAKDIRTPDGRRVGDRFLEERLILLDLRQALRARGIPEDHVPNFFESGSGDQPFIALSLAPGTSADKMLLEEENRAGLPEPVAIAMMERFVAVLETLHLSLRRTYTDVQLDNLFWQPTPDGEPGEGHLTVIDWNVVSVPLPEQPTPEQQADFDQRVLRDITLCGVFLLRLLTRQLAPLSGIPLADLIGMERWAELSRGTRDLIGGLLNLDPAQRKYRNASDLKQRLSEIKDVWNDTTSRDAQREVQQFEDQYQAIQGDKELLFEWALKVDAVLPIFEKRKLLDLATQKRLTARVGDLVRNPVAMMGKGRIYFDGTRYANAVEEFSRAERAGLGLTALRWRLLAGLVRRELDTETNGNFGAFKGRLVEAVEALEARRWAHPALAVVPEAPLLHAFFTGEANIRHALEAEYPQQAYAFETDHLNPLPDPLEPGSGDLYRRALRAETGDLESQAQEAAQHARLADARAQHRTALIYAWEQYRAAIEDQIILQFAALIETLTHALSEARGDAEWLALTQAWAKTLADESQFEGAKALLDLALGYCLNVHLDLHRENRLVGLLAALQSHAASPDAVPHLTYPFLAETASLHLPAFRQSSALRQHQLFENLFLPWQACLQRPDLRQTALRLRAILQQLKPAWNPREEETIVQATQLIQEDKPLQAQQLLGSMPEAEMPEKWHRLWEKGNDTVNKALAALTPENPTADNMLLDWLKREPGQKKLLDTAVMLADAWFFDKNFKPVMTFVEAVCPYVSPSMDTPESPPPLPCAEERLDRLYRASQWAVKVNRLEEKQVGELQTLVQSCPREFPQIINKVLEDKIEKEIVKEWKNLALFELIGLAKSLPGDNLPGQLRARQILALIEVFVTQAEEVRKELTHTASAQKRDHVAHPDRGLLTALKLDAKLWPAYQAHIERILFTERDLSQAREDLMKVRDLLGTATLNNLEPLAQIIDEVSDIFSFFSGLRENYADLVTATKNRADEPSPFPDHQFSQFRDELIKARALLRANAWQEEFHILPRVVGELTQILSFIPDDLSQEDETHEWSPQELQERLRALNEKLQPFLENRVVQPSSYSKQVGQLFVSLLAEHFMNLSESPPTAEWIRKIDEFLENNILKKFDQEPLWCKQIETAWKHLGHRRAELDERPSLEGQMEIFKSKFDAWYQNASSDLKESEGNKLARAYHRRFMALLDIIGTIEHDINLGGQSW